MLSKHGQGNKEGKRKDIKCLYRNLVSRITFKLNLGFKTNTVLNNWYHLDKLY